MSTSGEQVSSLYTTFAMASLYAEKGLNIQTFDKKYLVSFQDRNNRESEHLMITNYEQEPNLTLWSRHTLLGSTIGKGHMSFPFCFNPA